MDRYEAMRSFVRVVDSGGISAAAETLGVAKSAVSRRLTELEAHLGAQLLVRTTRRVNVTDAGRAYYDRCVGILAEITDAEAALASDRQSLKGRLRVAAPLSFGLRHLGPALIEFARAHPDLEVDIDFSDRFVDLVAEGFDLGVRIGELQDSSLVARRLTDARFTLSASPAFAAGLGPDPEPAALQDQPLLRYASQSAAAIPYRAPDGRTGNLRLRAVMTATNGEFLRDAASAGLGLTLLPNFVVYDALASGALVPVLPEHRWRDISAYAIYPPTRHLSLRVRRFIDFLSGRYGERPYWDEPCPVPAAKAPP